jgi:hypothetical protein
MGAPGQAGRQKEEEEEEEEETDEEEEGRKTGRERIMCERGGGGPVQSLRAR